MHVQTFSHLLNEIAEREIPDDMNSLWPSIQAQLPPAPHRRAHRALRWSWATALIMLSLILSVATYAFYQGSRRDPGLEWVEQNELVTPVGETITLDGVSVTLDWVYADAARIAVAYSAARENTGDNLGFAGGPGPALCLIAPDGSEWLPQTGSPGDSPYAIEADSTFSAEWVENVPADLGLMLHVWLSIAPIPPTASPDATGGSGGSGGGGGGSGGGDGSNEPLHCGDPAWLQMMGITGDVVGPFTFDFTVPFYPAVIDTSGQMATAGGQTITLEQVSYTPSMTEITACFAPPDPAQTWSLFGSLDTGEQNIDLAQALGGPPHADGRQCVALSFAAPYKLEADEWTLTLDRLDAPLNVTPENFAEFKALFAAHGVTIELVDESGSGFGWATTAFAEGATFEDAWDAILTERGLLVRGPWVFALDVPAAG